MACGKSPTRCPTCNDTDYVCPENETGCENPPPQCPICGDTDCMCPDDE